MNNEALSQHLLRLPDRHRGLELDIVSCHHTTADPVHHIIATITLRQVLRLNPGAKGLINGVLRSATRAMEEGNMPNPDDLVGPSTSGRELVRGLAIQHRRARETLATPSQP